MIWTDNGVELKMNGNTAELYKTPLEGGVDPVRRDSASASWSSAGHKANKADKTDDGTDAPSAYALLHLIRSIWASYSSHSAYSSYPLPYSRSGRLPRARFSLF